MRREEILLCLTDGKNHAVGNIWRVTAKKSDFYIDPWGVGEVTGLHVSAHGPNERNPGGHRFHVKIDRDLATNGHGHRQAVQFNIPRKGLAFDGVLVGPRAWRIARLRWTWELQRRRFHAAALTGIAPEITESRSGLKQNSVLSPNEAWDVDLHVSYEEPFWPDPVGSHRENARVGPLRNGAGLWLTGTSYGMSRLKRPSPDQLEPPLPGHNEEASRIMCGGLDLTVPGGMYWFVETITSRGFVETMSGDRWWGPRRRNGSAGGEEP